MRVIRRSSASSEAGSLQFALDFLFVELERFSVEFLYDLRFPRRSELRDLKRFFDEGFEFERDPSVVRSDSLQLEPELCESDRLDPDFDIERIDRPELELDCRDLDPDDERARADP